MPRCGACEHPDAGYVHTCAGSGTYVAAEAYDADAVLEQASKDWPYFTVTIQTRMRAQDEHMIRDKLTPLVTGLLTDEFTEHSQFSIEQDDPVTA